ncbi:MAG: Na/Pi symporter [Candidatus Celaenobacter antarcticus]|nr:Na/Pi symporter [Candidatus Celaenobacter antarcticus]MDP8314095.1 Na/Pi symporter [Candidatus Celaenobacter antarcticus]
MPDQNTTNLNKIFKILLLIILIYFFFLSIVMMGAGFKSFSGLSENLIASVSNPIMGLLIGILTTSIVQSSSTTTSIVVGLVASNILGADSIRIAIPIIMGANIGTTITNTIVSLGHISRTDEFKRAYGCAIVHDIFNIIVVAILLPLEIYFGFIEKISLKLGSFILHANIGGAEFKSPIGMITKPIVGFLYDPKYPDASPGFLQKLFSQPVAQILILVIAMIFLFIALKYMVKVIRQLVIGKVENFFSDYIFRNGVLALLLGLVLTAIVQSSSITTSIMVPLAGAGIVNIYQIFPYTVGANIGTTVTTLLAAMATGSPAALVVALSHFTFNVLGMILILPLKPIRMIPIKIALWVSNLTTKSKIYPILFIIMIFFVIPIFILLITKR